MKIIGIILSLIVVLLCFNISQSEADSLPLAVFQVTMTASGQSVTPTINGNNYSYGDLTQYHQDNLIVGFNTSLIGSATSLDTIGGIYTWPGWSSAEGIEDYYFRLTPKKTIPSNIFKSIANIFVTLNITYAATVYGNSPNPDIFVEAEMEIRPPGGLSANQLFFLSNTESGSAAAQGVAKVLTLAGQVWGIHLLGAGYANLTAPAAQSLFFHSWIDPTIVIDTDRENTFNIDGVEYSAADLFDVELSSNLAVPVPGALWLFGSGLLGLAGWRRFRKG